MNSGAVDTGDTDRSLKSHRELEAAQHSAPSGLGGCEMERSYLDATNASSSNVGGVSGVPRARS